ncbi:MAG: hypothetical protein ACQEQV_05415 [Fibrobacterota bacterium]
MIQKIMLVSVLVTTFLWSQEVLFVGFGAVREGGRGALWDQSFRRIMSASDNIELLSSRSSGLLREHFAQSGNLAVTPAVLEYIRKNITDAGYLVKPQVVDFTIEPQRGGFLWLAVRYHYDCSVKYTVIDIGEGQEVISTIVRTQFHRFSELSPPWRNPEDESALSSATREKMIRRGVEDNLRRFEKILQSLLRKSK